jgi:hypothetical protein
MLVLAAFSTSRLAGYVDGIVSMRERRRVVQRLLEAHDLRHGMVTFATKHALSLSSSRLLGEEGRIGAVE